jgi:lysylphosphatidylglycerol synthetase-like protein (DUF2156 family)
MVRIAAAILAGYVAVGILVVLTDLIFAAAIPGFRNMATQPPYYFVIVTFTNTLYSLVGGYLCAIIARAAIRRATVGLMIFGEIFGVVSAVLSWNSQPHWFGLALLVLFPVAVWCGSQLRSRSAGETSMAFESP